MERISVVTKKRTDFVEITEQIEEIIKRHNVKNGICFLFVPHTTCGLTINENADPSVRRDIMEKLEELIPENDNYSHTEGNADSHIKSTITGHSLTIFIENGVLQLGTWQGIYLCEFDGPRTRQVWIKIIPTT
ncbi:MAG: secondary thiamine-phosphate synthase enzyme YjbQ [Candidatus Omnitrophica bacterium]|nr:secondary thiamine-phosphate synthase enzyme YjbQ [Candidatus Omnitrophota bacterium]MCM8806844.1 secondary thiamine-phosphate synthase enzyme YjbQ [Candidatus Omnitrophota bacterium]